MDADGQQASAAALAPGRLAPELALRAPGLLGEFNRAGVLGAAEVHVALTLGDLTGVQDQRLLLAAALAVRAPRLGHVFVDLDSAQRTVVVEEQEEEEEQQQQQQQQQRQLPWPEPAGWVAAVGACEQLVAGTGKEPRPLRLEGARLYLDRYWQEERALAAALRELAAAPPRQLDLERLRGGIARLFPEPEDALQRLAAACVALRGLAVIAGGPGTGKTTAIARATALIFEQVLGAEPAATPVRPARPDHSGPVPLVALCAPTGRAATRLQQAVHAEAQAPELSAGVSAALLALRGSTIHRLLGWRGGWGASAFRYGPENRLPHDLVIVDETSMASLSLMTRLLGAIRSDAQLVLVGDPDQLAAIEAGAVMRDIVGPAADGARFAPGMRALAARVTGDPQPRTPGEANAQQPRTPGDANAQQPQTPGDANAQQPRTPGDANAQQPQASGGGWFGDGVVTLRRGHRFGAVIGALADAIRRGDGEATLAALTGGEEAISWIPGDAAASQLLRDSAVSAYGTVMAAARAGDAAAALAALGSFRLLCAHRHGRYGVGHWTAQVESWLADALRDFEPGTGGNVGQPLLITENDHELRLYNGDVGVIIERDAPRRTVAAFERDGELVWLAPARLAAVEPLYAMTIHKSQGSQFDLTAVVLPEPDSPILTRELLYTAVTRARRRLILVGAEESVLAAVARPVGRATGLQELLW